LLVLNRKEKYLNWKAPLMPKWLKPTLLVLAALMFIGLVLGGVMMGPGTPLPFPGASV
jgi:hypothetical protein